MFIVRIMSEHEQSLYRTSVFTFVKFYALNVVASLSDWMLSSEFLGIHKSPVDPKDPLNISLPYI